MNVENDDEALPLAKSLTTEGKQLPEKWRNYNARWTFEWRRTFQKTEKLS